jgi:UDP-glucose 4-epimerase
VPARRLYEIELADTSALTGLMRQLNTEAVVHFAAFIAVGESMVEPERYFVNNVSGSLSLLSAMQAAGVKHIVFSSTAAVYGSPDAVPILETSPIQALNPYGESKVMVETLLGWFDRIHHLTSVCLRYFNAAGGAPDGRLGEQHEPETHLIPLILRAVLSGKPVTVFGQDYDTPDGTCIRDYIHVEDLAEAHVLALEYLLAGGRSDQFNVGTGTGHSVMEVIHAVEKITGQKVPYLMGTRRAGDPARLVASSDKLRSTLGWQPRSSDLNTIVTHAWEFARQHR